jgi:UDP-N-acetylenolpyruvoylglucosamine reductase
MSKPSVFPGSARQTAGSMADDLLQRVSPGSVIRRNEPMAKHTTLRVGGPADIYLEPASEEDVAQAVRFCAEQKLPFFTLGRGSNLLVRDGGYRGLIICLAQPRFSQIEVEGRRLRCGSGAKLRAVAVEARRNSLTGLEFLEGIPGTVGGALRMNAGAMGSAMSDVVESVRLMDFCGKVHQRTISELNAGYRSCATLKTYIALSAVLGGQPGLPEMIEARMSEFSRKRWQSQPAAPSAGCAFKNPAQIPAGKLIDELDLKGTRVGGAYVSAEHGNFIVNGGTATARDVLELIEIIRARARTQRGIELETEVEIIGE